MSFWDMGILIHITVSRCKYSFAFIFVSSVIVVACITLVGGSGSPLSLSLSLSLSQNWDGVIGGDRREKGWSITQGWPALPLQLCFIYLFIMLVMEVVYRSTTMASITTKIQNNFITLSSNLHTT